MCVCCVCVVMCVCCVVLYCILLSVGTMAQMDLVSIIAGAQGLPSVSDNAPARDVALDGAGLLGRRDIGAGLRYLPCRPAKRCLDLYTGENYRGRQHSLYLHQCKHLKKERREKGAGRTITRSA